MTNPHRRSARHRSRSSHPDREELARIFEDLYARFQTRRYVHPDPVEFLYEYDNPSDREIAGLIAASLAYGRVAQIVKSVSSVLDCMGPSPSRFVARTKTRRIESAFRYFKHRFTTGEELAALLTGIHRVREHYGSLRACFLRHYNDRDETVIPALTSFVGEFRQRGVSEGNSLLPSPEAGSACKRLHLYLRWMVRRDDVDMGDWSDIAPSKLVIPLDTHMHRMARALGFTGRTQADLKTALEVTAAFRAIVPGDPVRYDFILTRQGIWGNGNIWKTRAAMK